MNEMVQGKAICGKLRWKLHPLALPIKILLQDIQMAYRYAIKVQI